MASLVIRPFQPADYTALAPPGWVKGPGPAYTATVDGEVAGCAGVTLAGAEYGAWGTAWALLGPLGRAHPRFVVMAVAKGLSTIIHTHKLVRVEADVLADYHRSRRWVEWMGFREESAMPLRGPGGTTMIRYVIFPKENGQW